MSEFDDYQSESPAIGQLEQSVLGRKTAFVARYTPSLLFGLERSDLREGLVIDSEQLPFFGADLWTAFELNWLNRDGKPEIGIVHLTVPCDSPSVLESKSLKLYLMSFSQTKFTSAYDVARTLEADISVTVGAAVMVDLLSISQALQHGVNNVPGDSLDNFDVSCDTYLPSASLLETDPAGGDVHEVLYSNLLRSICPATGQPDTGSVQISYRGGRIEHDSLLRYIVSYREHSAFHEQCVERMFLDIMDACAPKELTVHACYNRRGGIDINPLRSTEKGIPTHFRLVRQ